ncbi:DUF501 domain-containing protein [Persephonella sp.]
MGKTGLFDLEKNFSKMVIENHPIQIDSKKGIPVPQPTRFWITDGWLKKEISRLEEKGWIQKWEDMVTQDKSLFKQFIQLHRKEIEVRKSIISELHLPQYVVEKLMTTGIGGIQEFDKKPFKVKCLHLWTAYHIGDPRFRNPLGEFVLNQIKMQHQNR